MGLVRITAPVPSRGPVTPRWRVRAEIAPGLSPLLGQGRWMPIHEQPDRSAYRLETPGGTFFAKLYAPRGLRARVRDFLVARKPYRAFRYGAALGQAGVATPHPLGLYLWGEGLPRAALLVTDWLEQAGAWPHHLLERAPRSRFPQAYQRALGDMASLLGRLHRLGYYHGDLAGNVFFARLGEGFGPFLVDLESLRRGLPRRRRVKNLEELGRAVRELDRIGLRDRWAFLRAYAEAAGLSHQEARALWREGREAQLRRLAEKQGS